MVAENIKIIRRRIALACERAGRNPDDVTCLAVTKMFGSSRIREALDAGVFDIGENFVQELRQKREELKDGRIRWHFIGHLQANKIKYIIEWIHLIHSLDSTSLAKEIS